MADIDLPVFSFRANWREGVTERLSFLTDVLRAEEGAEQRRGVRQTPRRSLEADFLLQGPERTFWDLFINRLGGGEMMVPLYWDIVTLEAPLIGGVSDSITFDPTRREFAPGLAILSGASALEYEVVEITAITPYGVDLASTVAASWPERTVLMPLRRALLEDVGDLNHYTKGVATATAQVTFNTVNPWEPAEDDSPVYSGLPVFLEEPNWVEPLAVNFDRSTFRLDTSAGLLYQVDSMGRAVLGQSHRWFLPGREKLARFRDLIYRHQGRRGAFWLPTFKADLRLVNSPGSGATQIEVEKVGYGYVGGPSSGREYIAIQHDEGTILRRVTSVIAGTSAATERVNLDSPLGLALSPGQVRQISFADTARFDQDDFEITHFTGLDGHTEASATFRTFKNSRTAPTPTYYPIPASETSFDECGTAPGDCYFDPPPDWFMAVRVDFGINVPVNSNPGWLWWRDGTLKGAQYIGPPNVEKFYSPGALDQHFFVYMFDDVHDVPHDWRLRLQFAAGSVNALSKARVSYQKRFEETWTIVSPQAGSWSFDEGGGLFDIRGLYTSDWYFNF